MRLLHHESFCDHCRLGSCGLCAPIWRNILGRRCLHSLPCPFHFHFHFHFHFFSIVCFPGSDSDVSVQCSADSRQMLQSLLSGQMCSSDNGCPPMLLCMGGKCSACSSDAQCAAHNPHNRCSSSSSDSHPFCAHKTLWQDFGATDVLLLIIIFFSTALSAPTGTGGGGIMVPVFMLMCGFTAQDAIPLSKVHPCVRERSLHACFGHQSLSAFRLLFLDWL